MQVRWECSVLLLEDLLNVGLLSMNSIPRAPGGAGVEVRGGQQTSRQASDAAEDTAATTGSGGAEGERDELESRDLHLNLERDGEETSRLSGGSRREQQRG